MWSQQGLEYICACWMEHMVEYFCILQGAVYRTCAAAREMQQQKSCINICSLTRGAARGRAHAQESSAGQHRKQRETSHFTHHWS